ncbi:MAG: hypothetical protein D6732_25060, partial [Methanobacteriota archaeon]
MSKKQFFFKQIALTIVFWCIPFSQYAQSQYENLARVLILPYFDNTNTKLFGYMPNAIYEGLNVSMKDRFEYREVKLNTQWKKKIPKKGKPKKSLIRQLAKSLDCDFIIYGYFNYNKKENKIVIHTYIYLAYEDKFVRVADTKNPVDTTIFIAVDKVSEKLVAEIRKIAEAQMQEEKTLSSKKTINLLMTQDKDKEELARLKRLFVSNYEGTFYTLEEYEI